MYLIGILYLNQINYNIINKTVFNLLLEMIAQKQCYLSNKSNALLRDCIAIQIQEKFCLFRKVLLCHMTWHKRLDNCAVSQNGFAQVSHRHHFFPFDICIQIGHLSIKYTLKYEINIIKSILNWALWFQYNWYILHITNVTFSI